MDCLHHLLILYPPATGAYEIGCLVARRRVRVAVLPPLFTRSAVMLVRTERFGHGGVVLSFGQLFGPPYQMMIKLGTEHVSTVIATIPPNDHSWTAAYIPSMVGRMKVKKTRPKIRALLTFRS